MFENLFATTSKNKEEEGFEKRKRTILDLGFLAFGETAKTTTAATIEPRGPKIDDPRSLTAEQIKRIHEAGFPTIGQAPPPTIREKIGRFFDPVTSFLTGLEPRERGYTIKTPEGELIREPGVGIPTREVRWPYARMPAFDVAKNSPLAIPAIAVNFIGRIAEIPLRGAAIGAADVSNLIASGLSTALGHGEFIDILSKQNERMWIPFDARRIGFEEKTITTAAGEYLKMVEAGYTPLESGLLVGSSRTLEVAIAGSIISSSANIVTNKLAKAGGGVAKVDAWKRLGAPKNAEEALKNYHKEAHIFHPDMPLGSEALFKRLGRDYEILKKGVPTKADFVKYHAWQATEPFSRQTVIANILKEPLVIKVPAQEAAKVNLPGWKITEKTSAYWKFQIKPETWQNIWKQAKTYPERMAKPGLGVSPFAPYISDIPITDPTRMLPGYRPVPGQPAPFGLSIQNWERVGGEKAKIASELVKKVGAEKANQIIASQGEQLVKNVATMGMTKAITEATKVAIKEVKPIPKELEPLAGIAKPEGVTIFPREAIKLETPPGVTLTAKQKVEAVKQHEYAHQAVRKLYAMEAFERDETLVRLIRLYEKDEAHLRKTGQPPMRKKFEEALADTYALYKVLPGVLKKRVPNLYQWMVENGDRFGKLAAKDLKGIPKELPEVKPTIPTEKTFYHVTSKETAGMIIKEGLRMGMPSLGGGDIGKGEVFVTSNLERAKIFKRQFDETAKEDISEILVVKPSKEIIAKFIDEPDPSLGMGSYKYEGDIPAKFISRLEVKPEVSIKAPKTLDAIITEEAKALQEIESRLGVTTIPKPGYEGEQFIRVSEHTQWYKDFWKDNKRAPDLAEWKERARSELGAGRSVIGQTKAYKAMEPVVVEKEIDVEALFKEMDSAEKMDRLVRSQLISAQEKESFLKTLKLDLAGALEKARRLTPTEGKQVARAFEEFIRTSGIKERMITLPETQLLKNKIQALARGAREGSIATRRDILKAGDDLKATLKVAKVDPADAKWFTDTFKNIKGIDDLAIKLPSIIARIDRLADAREIRNLKSAIIDEVKTAKPEIGPKKALESKLGAETQRQMDFLRGATKESVELTGRITSAGKVLAGVDGSRAKALTRIEENINKYGTANEGVTAEIPLEIVKQNALLNMTGIREMSVAELRSVLSNIQSLKETGQLKVLIGQSNKAAEIEMIQDIAKTEFQAAATKPEVVGAIAKEMNPAVKLANIIENAILGTRNILEKITFSKEFKAADWMGNAIREARNGHHRLGAEWGNTKVRTFKETFGEKRIGKIYQEMSKEKLVFSGKNYLGKPVEMKLNQFEAAYWWGLTKDPTNLPIFIRNMDFTPEMFKALDKFVDPRMKKYTEYLMTDWLDKQIYPVVNARYQTKFGMDMPKNPNYLPRLYGDKNFEEEITNLLAGEAFPVHPSTVPSGVKARIGSRAAFRKISIEQVARRHTEQMNQFVHFDEVISDARRVVMDPEVKSAILRSSGQENYNTLIKKIDDIARGGMATQMKLTAIDWFVGKFTQASLMVNWVPFLKQITSWPAFTLGRGGLTYSELTSGSMVYARHPVEWTKKLAQSDFIFGRLTKGFNRETALAFRKGDRSFTLKEVDMTLGNFLTKAAITPTRGGDMVPILPGLTAKYLQVTKYLQRTTKLSAEEIHKRALMEAEVLASRTQQSPWIEDMGRIQTANSVGKAISMYSTTPIQYLRESMGAVRMWHRKQIPFGTMLRTIITAWIILPQLFQYVSNGFNWNNERQLRALLLGPINYYPAAGDLMGTFYDAFAKGEKWKTVASGISPLFSIPENMQQMFVSLHKILFKDAKDPAKEWAKFAEKLYTVVALTSGKLPSTAPRTIEGIIDLIQGDAKDLRRIWFSEYSLETEEGEESVFPELPKLPKMPELPKLPKLPKIPSPR